MSNTENLNVNETPNEEEPLNVDEPQNQPESSPDVAEPSDKPQPSSDEPQPSSDEPQPSSGEPQPEPESSNQAENDENETNESREPSPAPSDISASIRGSKNLSEMDLESRGSIVTQSESSSTMKSTKMYEPLTPRKSQAISSVRHASFAFNRRKSGVSMKSTFIDMTNTELMTAVQELQKNKKHLELENMVLTNFLEKNDPTALEGMETTVKSVQFWSDRTSTTLSRRLTQTRYSVRKEEQTFLPIGSSAALPSIGDKSISEKDGPRINTIHKMDMVNREMEELKQSLTKVTKKCNRYRQRMRAELEEVNAREAEIQETLDLFDDVFISCTSDKYPQKNPADKFARFMDERFKLNRTLLDKMRLRISSLKVQYQKVSAQLIEKRQLGENLQEVDFEQLEIENKHLIEKIDNRAVLLLELKKLNGKANYLLSRTKKTLGKKMESLSNIRETIKFREELIDKLDQEIEKVTEELERAKEDYDRVKMKSENYEVPPVLEYVKKKAELSVVRKHLKVWTRRNQIKEMALAASVRELKGMTGKKPTKSSLIETSNLALFNARRTDVDVENILFEFVFEKRARENKPEKKTKVSKRKLSIRKPS